jgi:hypothetical protein
MVSKHPVSDDPEVDDARRARSDASAKGCGRLVIGGIVVVALAIAGIFGWLLSRTGGAREALDAYVAAARSGAQPTPVHPDADTAETTRVLGTSTDLTVHNFAVVYGTGCYSTNVTTPRGSVPVEFFLEEKGDVWRVASLSTHRGCHCVRSGPREQQGCAVGP